jgi:hypothetical protein
MSVKRKIVSISLIATLVLNSIPSNLYAEATSYMDDSILQNVTPAGTYTDPMSGANYMYGGSVIFKFKDSASGTRPIIEFSPPRIKAGCNGISFTGGMLSVLGLDGIADQIQNAGTAVVYGILVGIIYSLPALEKVFQHIRQWAEWLQKFLRDACGQGRALGASLANTGPFKDAVGLVQSPFETSVRQADNFMEKVFGEPGKYTGTELRDYMVSVYSGKKDATNSKEPEDRAVTFEKNFRDYYQRLGIANVVLSEEYLKNGSLTTEEPEFKVIDPNESEATQLYTILVNFFGDLTIDDESVEFMSKYGDIIVQITNTGIYKEDGSDKEKQFFGEIAEIAQSGSSASMKKKLKISFVQPYVDPARAARILIHGSSLTDGSNPGEENKEFKAPQIMRLKVPVFGSTKVAESLVTLGLVTTQTQLKWKGLYAVSKDKIQCEVETAATNTSCSNTFPLIIPGIDKYINIIKTIELSEAKRNNETGVKSNAQSEALKDDLANYNAYFYAKFILHFIERDFRSNLQKLNGEEAALEFDKSFAVKKKAILDELGEIVSKDPSLLDTLRARFKNLELEQKQDRSRGY